MTPETRRRVLRYGIAIDLVVLATAVGLLVTVGPLALLTMFVAAAALSAWKGGWQGGTLAIALSLVAAVYFFPEAFDGSRLVGMVAASIAAAAIVRSAVPGGRLSTRMARPAGITPTFDPIPLAELRADAEQRSIEHQTIARGLERAAVAQLERLHAVPPPPPPPALVVVPPEENLEQLRRQADEEVAARVAVAREELRREIEQRVASRVEEERARAERTVQERVDAEVAVARRNADEVVHERLAQERAAIQVEINERVKEKITAERAKIEQQVRKRVTAERKQLEPEIDEEVRRELAAESELAKNDLQTRLARAREEHEREASAALESARRAAEEELARRLEDERAAVRARIDEAIAAERAALQKEMEQRVEALRAEQEREPSPPRGEGARRADEGETPLTRPSATLSPQAGRGSSQESEGIFARVKSWFRPARRSSVNLAPRRSVGGGTLPRKPAPAAPTRPAKVTAPRKPRLLLLERRRGTADTVAPKLRQKGVEVEVVERWVDAVDELFRFRPDVLLLDIELPEVEKIHKTITEQSPTLPIYMTGRVAHGYSGSARNVGYIARPYDAEQLAKVARDAMEQPEALFVLQQASRPEPVKSKPMPVAPTPPAPAPPPVALGKPAPAPAPTVSVPKGEADTYEVSCFTCRVPFDATDADWCSCLAKERTLVCTNCLTCFCKAPPAYKEKFWLEAPPRLFERKTADAKRSETPLHDNPPPEQIRRPLVLSVEDDEDIQRIVQRVCHNLGYGFIRATNGQDGLDIARAYRPNLILSDAFMPKLDGREMCRILKQEPVGENCTMVVMTGLYTDTKYRSEALKRFHVDDYLAKPVAITDLINLLQRHLEGVAGLPHQEDLHAIHRAAMDDEPEMHEEEIALAELLDEPPMIEEPKPKPKPPRSDVYEVCCYNCNAVFDATRAEWCSCLGRDQTLVCGDCGGCFCKAPSAYKERFWVDAPPSLFERKMIGSKRNTGSRNNPAPHEVARPLILLVEDDENIQLIVRTVVTTMGFGFIVGANGQEGLALARSYNPDLILSDAFMPKLDGREMCRLLKEDPSTARTKAIIMTGLYTDRKYRNEALDYFKVDDYVAKPLAVDDLIKLFKKHLPQEVQPTM